ncbi:MAG: tetratricopeptide repeat protein [Syntrophobacteraceae bacterium]|nr:tetratricopeptide repeat protein [Syntrophobacteraceae bacterium]
MLNNLKKYRYDSLVVIGLVVVTAAVYGQVLNHEFIIYDDPAYVTENYVVREGVSWKGFLWAFTTLAAANWHPLTWLSHMLDVQLFGMQLGMHHLMNVIFHVLNTALLFLVLRQMTGAPWRSAFVAALFALHPLHVESVAWVAERKDVLSSFFWLLTMWAYARYAQKPGLPSYWPVLLFFSLGLLAKPMLVSLPLVLFLMDYWPLGRLRGKRETAQAPMTSSAMPEKQGKKRKQQLRVQKRPPAAKGAGKWDPVLPLVYEKIPLLALSAASSMITLYAQQKGGAVAPLSAVPLADRIANALVSSAAYLWKMFWPSELAVYYPLEALPPALVLASASLLLALTFFAVRWAGKYPYLLAGWLWYLVTLLPVVGIVKVGDVAMADRYTYIPLIGPFIALAWGAFDLSQALRLPRAALAAVSALALCASLLMAHSQIGQWRDSVTLYSHAIDAVSKNYGAHTGLAIEYIRQKKYAEALPHLESSLQLNPHYADTNLYLGIHHYHAGRYPEAVERINRGLRVKPNWDLAHEWLGKTYLAMGKADQAMYYFQLAGQAHADNAPAYTGMSEIFIAQNRLDEALQYTLRAIESQPQNARMHNNAGFILIRQGKVDEAIPRFQEAIRIAPDYARAHNNLGGALMEKNRVDEAIHHFKEAVRLEPGNQLARENLKYALAQKKQVKKSGR